MKRFTDIHIRACSTPEIDNPIAAYVRSLRENAIKPPVNTAGRGPWVVMYQGETADQLRALAASLLIAADTLEDEQVAPVDTERGAGGYGSTGR